jgi:hypothetical protein
MPRVVIMSYHAKGHYVSHCANNYSKSHYADNYYAKSCYAAYKYCAECSETFTEALSLQIAEQKSPV